MQAQRRRGAGWLGGLVGASVLALTAFGVWQAGSAKAQAAPTFSVSPATQTVDFSAGTAQVEIHLDGVTGMASYQFVLRYDPGVLKDPVVVQGPLLATSGRAVTCPAALIDGLQNGVGTLQFGCASSGSGDGANGSGVVATVTFTLAGGANSTIGLEKLSISNSLNESLCGTGCAKADGAITVNGGDPGKNEGIAPTPTPVVLADDTPAASPTPGPGTPTAAATPALSGSARTPAAGGSGTISAGGRGSGGVAETGTVAGGVGRLGTGAAQRRRGDGALIWALAVAGAVLLPAGIIVKRRAVE